MTNRSELPPLPGEDEYLTAIAQTDQLFSNGGGPRPQLDRYVKAMSMDRRRFEVFRNAIVTLASIVEPMDRTTGEFNDGKHGRSHALHYGSTAGLMVVNRVHEGVVAPRDVFEDIHVNQAEDPTDRFANLHALGSQVIDLGEQGLSLVGDASYDIVDTWESRTIEDVNSQRMFRIGFGIVALGAYVHHEQMIEKNEQEAMAKALESLDGMDWDNALDGLLNDHRSDGGKS